MEIVVQSGFLNCVHLKFSVIQCPSKKLRGKPFPDTLIYAINTLKFHRKNTFYVGDTRNDSLAAKRCNVKFIYATYGYGRRSIKAFATINKFKDILKLDFS